MPTTYLSPGVYVEEVPSGSVPIAGVGTSTTGFVGVVHTTKPTEGNQKPATPAKDELLPSQPDNFPEQVTTHTTKTETVPVNIKNELADKGKVFSLRVPTLETGETWALPASAKDQATFKVNGNDRTAFELILNEEGVPAVSFTTDVEAGAQIIGTYPVEITTPAAVNTASVPKPQVASLVVGPKDSSAAANTSSNGSNFYWLNSVNLGEIGTGDGSKNTFTLDRLLDTDVELTVKVSDQDHPVTATITNPNGAQVSTLTLETPPQDKAIVSLAYRPKSAAAGDPKLCTNFSEFKAFFGDFSDPVQNADQNRLAHAVYGFFRNGGTRCYVTWVNDKSAVAQTLEDKFEPIDEIAIVVAPGQTTKEVQQAVADHCQKMGDRFAILDGPEEATLSSANLTSTIKHFNSKYAALYFPWLQVYDPTSKGAIDVPPSGHIAGIYGRVDSQRGVHKAPANEPVLGATGLKYSISKAKQAPLNKDGINCIRSLNGNILVWGARTLGGDANGEYKYVSTQRLLSYLCESIDEGTQWTVFEPNSPELWAAIRRNVSSFLTTVWRSGALFGNTPEQAFYVKCDAETNPPDLREKGQVVTEIGVSIVKPAEFVIFRLSQWSGNEG